MQETQLKVQQRADEKIQNSEFIMSTLGVEGTKLGVLLLDASQTLHVSSILEIRNSDLLELVSITIKPLIIERFQHEFHTPHYDWNVSYVRDKWDNNQNRIIKISSFIFDMVGGISNIDRIIGNLSKSPIFANLLCNLYNKGVSDIVFSTLGGLGIFNYFLYNTKITTENPINEIYDLPLASGQESYFIESEYDRFKSLKKISKQNFSFAPKRYEVWENGELEESGGTNHNLVASIVYVDNMELVRLDILDHTLYHDIFETQFFDDFISQHDRLQLITIPRQTNIESNFLSTYMSINGSTRDKKIFNKTDSYCCNIFLKRGKIVKMSFMLANPDRVLEFYNN